MRLLLALLLLSTAALSAQTAHAAEPVHRLLLLLRLLYSLAAYGVTVI